MLESGVGCSEETNAPGIRGSEVFWSSVIGRSLCASTTGVEE